MENQLRNTSLTLITGVFTLLIQLATNFFLSPFIVRTLGEAANGFTQLANNFVTYASLITIAFNSMAGRFMSVSYHKQEHPKVNKYYSSIVVCNIVIICVFIPLAIYLVHNLETMINTDTAELGDVKSLFFIVFLNFLGNLVLSTLGLAFFVKNKLYLQNVFNLFRNALNALMLLFFFGLFPPKMFFVSLSGLLFTIASIPVYSYLKKKIYPALKFSFSNFSIKALMEMLGSGIWNTVNQAGHILMTGLDLLLANLFIGTSEMGLISISQTLLHAVTALANVINTSFLPKTIMVWTESRGEKLALDLRKLSNISCLLLSIPLGVVCVFSNPFFSLWMPSLDATKLSILLLLGVMPFIPLAGGQILYNVFTAANKLKLNSISFLISGVINVLVVYLLLQHFHLGIYAIVGVASGVRILRSMVFVLPYTAKILGIKPFFLYKDAVGSVVAVAMTAIVSRIVLHFIPASNWILLILGVFVSCIFAASVVPFIVFDKSQRRDIMQEIMHLIRRMT